MTDGIAGTAAVFGCTDPRLADAATNINDQIKIVLGVGRIIPFFSPGIVGLYADASATKRPICLDEQRGDLCVCDIRRMALEASFGVHLSLHNPTVAVFAAHSDCKGHPGDDQAQQRDVRVAASVLQYRLRRQFNFSGIVYAAMLHRQDRHWGLEVLEKLAAAA